jgi:hypothetical protein
VGEIAEHAGKLIVKVIPSFGEALSPAFFSSIFEKKEMKTVET